MKSYFAEKIILSRVPKAIWALGFVSMFMDISSEMIHGVLPMYLTISLSASALSLGIIEGLSEAVALISRIFSGAVSDLIGRRKIVVGFGYGLSAVVKPIFPLSTGPSSVLIARLLDRLGKGIRGAPRDALVGELAPPDIRGACFGIRQSLDTVGAFAGPLLAAGILFFLPENYRLVMWIAVVPACTAVFLISFFVHEPERSSTPNPTTFKKLFSGISGLPRRYWHVLLLGGIYSLSRFSEAFLILRSIEAGLPASFGPLVLVVMNIAYAASSYPASKWSDKIGRDWIFQWGTLLLLFSDLLLALVSSPTFVMIGVVFWGLHMGFTQGVLASMIADIERHEILASAFGIFNFVLGCAVLIASVLAGWSWDQYGSRITFLIGAAFALGAWLISLFCSSE